MKMLRDRQIFWFAILTTCVLISFTPFFFLDDRAMLPLIEENGFYQNLTALAFFVASVFFILSYATQAIGNDFGRITTKRNVFLLLLGIVMFIGAGEELSWGQHMLGFEPPDSIAEMNRQGELNLHNLMIVSGVDAAGNPKTGLAGLFTISKLFGLFWLLFCVLIPLMAVSFSSVRKFLQRVNLPIVPLWIGLAFPVNHIFSRYVVNLTEAPGHYVMEVKETGFAVMFFLIAAELYLRHRQSNKVPVA
jgi:hypothetical protein